MHFRWPKMLHFYLPFTLCQVDHKFLFIFCLARVISCGLNTPGKTSLRIFKSWQIINLLTMNTHRNLVPLSCKFVKVSIHSTYLFSNHNIENFNVSVRHTYSPNTANICNRLLDIFLNKSFPMSKCKSVFCKHITHKSRINSTPDL